MSLSSRRNLLPLSLMAIAMSSAFTARAGTLYTIDVASNELQTFDTRTLQFTNVAAIAPNSFNFGDLAYSGSAMYMTQGFAGTGLYTLNLTTGAETLVGDMGRNDMFGLAFDQTGTLYGSLSSGGFTGLYSINPNNAAINLIGDPGHYLDGLTYLPTQNLLLGLNAGAGTLYGVNRTTGATTLLGGNQFINNCGIAYDPDTGLVWCLDWSGNVFTFNPNNNFAETLVMSGQDAHDGLASTESAAPEPATIAGVLVGFAALLRRRRK